MTKKKVMMSVTAGAAIASAFVGAEHADAASHTVQSGDSLWSIAQKHGTTVGKLKELNQLTSDRIFPNQVLETTSESTKKTNSPSSKSTEQKSTSNNTYTVKAGDTLSGIASKHNISLTNLMNWNELETTLIFPGNVLKVTNSGTSNTVNNAPKTSNNNKSSSKPSQNTTNYTIKSGDTLSKIASAHNVKVSDLRKWNNLRSDLIFPGQKLSIGAKNNTSSTTPANTNQSSSTDQKVSSSTVYTVKSGDTLSKIGGAYGVSVSNLKSWNNLTSDRIYIGQKLNIGASKSSSSGSSSSSSTSQNTSQDYNVDQLISLAKSLSGIPYKWGGTTTSGFDCSGFIYYVYNQAGKNINRLSTGGYFERSHYVNNPQVGDLVFFEGTYKSGISHMGIYLGNNQFIHAGSDGVAIASIDNSYWKKHFDSFKRFY